MSVSRNEARGAGEADVEEQAEESERVRWTSELRTFLYGADAPTLEARGDGNGLQGEELEH